MRVRIHLVLVVTLSIAVMAAADPNKDRRGTSSGPKPPVPPIVAVIDVNGDGVLSAEEIQNAAARLKMLDKNNDGQLSIEEYAGDKRADFVNRFVARFDANKDGLVSKEELPGHLNRMLEYGDGNKDGKLSRTEIEVLASKFSSGRQSSKRKRPEKPPGPEAEDAPSKKTNKDSDRQ